MAGLSRYLRINTRCGGATLSGGPIRLVWPIPPALVRPEPLLRMLDNHLFEG